LRRGENWSSAAPVEISTTTRGFTGHEQDDAIGLINMNARLYEPVIGRFLSPDSIVPDESFTQAFNRYSYVINNPLTLSDPTGHTYDPSDNGSTVDSGSGGASGSGSTSSGGPEGEVTQTSLGIDFDPQQQHNGNCSGHCGPSGDDGEGAENAVVESTPESASDPNPSSVGGGAGGSGVGSEHVENVKSSPTPDQVFGVVTRVIELFFKPFKWGKKARSVVKGKPSKTKEKYEILDGVKRAKANDVHGKTTVDVNVIKDNKVVEQKSVSLDSLKSPNKSTIELDTPEKFERWDSIQKGVKNGDRMDPIDVQKGSRGPSIRDVDFE